MYTWPSICDDQRELDVPWQKSICARLKAIGRVIRSEKSMKLCVSLAASAGKAVRGTRCLVLPGDCCGDLPFLALPGPVVEDTQPPGPPSANPFFSVSITNNCSQRCPDQHFFLPLSCQSDEISQALMDLKYWSMLHMSQLCDGGRLRRFS